MRGEGEGGHDTHCYMHACQKLLSSFGGHPPKINFEISNSTSAIDCNLQFTCTLQAALRYIAVIILRGEGN